MIEQILSALFGNAAFRALVTDITVRVIAEIFHRRSVDPEYLRKSDQIFEQIATAQTDEEKENAHRALQSLLSS